MCMVFEMRHTTLPIWLAVCMASIDVDLSVARGPCFLSSRLASSCSTRRFFSSLDNPSL